MKIFQMIDYEIVSLIRATHFFPTFLNGHRNMELKDINCHINQRVMKTSLNEHLSELKWPQQYRNEL